MRIDIDRKYFNPAKYSAITLLDSSCRATVSKLHITLDTIPQNCGSKRIQTDDYIVYENEVFMKAIPTDTLVTREHDVRIRFKCSYNRSDISSLKSFRPLTSIDVQEGMFIDKSLTIEEVLHRLRGLSRLRAANEAGLQAVVEYKFPNRL